jgi:hypothetical protein
MGGILYEIFKFKTMIHNIINIINRKLLKTFYPRCRNNQIKFLLLQNQSNTREKHFFCVLCRNKINLIKQQN